MIKFGIVLCCFISLVFCRITAPSSSEHANQINDSPNQSDSVPRAYASDLKFLYKTYQECTSTDLTTCLKLKLFTILDRVGRSKSDFKLIDGITFVKDADAPDDSMPIKTEEEVEESLPRSLEDKESKLDDLLFDRVMSFFKSHTLKVKFPSMEEMSIARGGGGGGLGGGHGGGGGGFGGGKDKDKKGHGHWIMIPLLLGSTLVPLAFGALALLAGKALIVSKLALALASIIGIKKLISNSHHHEGAHEVVVSGGHGSGWGRIGSGQGLAYGAYNP